ncbi:MAG TPA: hypothetical protein PKW90_22515, partial [Myxococcota bacterium]|nr:hypothetical protein [Myxococcota bacterium]
MWLLLACSLHLGAPPAGAWAVERLWVAMPEPGLEAQLRSALGRSLGELNAQEGAPQRPLTVQVEEATWRPLMRGPGSGDYEAYLKVLVEADGTIRGFSARSLVMGPHSAAEEKKAREAAFDSLSNRLADEVALWVSG